MSLRGASGFSRPWRQKLASSTAAPSGQTGTSTLHPVLAGVSSFLKFATPRPLHPGSITVIPPHREDGPSRACLKKHSYSLRSHEGRAVCFPYHSDCNISLRPETKQRNMNFPDAGLLCLCFLKKPLFCVTDGRQRVGTPGNLQEGSWEGSGILYPAPPSIASNELQYSWG